jgi:hypothetical protein
MASPVVANLAAKLLEISRAYSEAGKNVILAKSNHLIYVKLSCVPS